MMASPPLLPTTLGSSSYYQQGVYNNLQPQSVVNFNKTVSQPLPADSHKKKTLPNKTSTGFNALPPWHWALGTGATCGVVAGAIGAWLAGKQYQTNPTNGTAKIYYNLSPLNQTTLHFSLPITDVNGKTDHSFQSQTYTHRKVADGGLDLISADFWAERNTFQPELLRLEKLENLENLATVQKGYRLGEPEKQRFSLNVNTNKHFAIYDESGVFQALCAGENQAPYFKLDWQGDSFTGSVINTEVEATEPSYIEALTGSVTKEFGILGADFKNNLAKTATDEAKDLATSAEQFLTFLRFHHVPLQLPVNEKPPMPSGATLVKFPKHRLVSFAIGAIPVAVVVTALVGLVQWCMPPTKKKKQIKR